MDSEFKPCGMETIKSLTHAFPNNVICESELLHKENPDMSRNLQDLRQMSNSYYQKNKKIIHRVVSMHYVNIYTRVDKSLLVS